MTGPVGVALILIDAESGEAMTFVLRAEEGAGPRAMTVCDVCGRVERPPLHPCRFEAACSCWRGLPCRPIERTHQ